MLKHEQYEAKGLAATSTEVESLRDEIRDLRADIDASVGDPSSVERPLRVARRWRGQEAGGTP